MPKINVDELCEPIEIRVDGKDYTVGDISSELANKMRKIDKDEGEDKDDPKVLADILTELLHADPKDIAKLGMRKRTMLIVKLMGIINEELEGKNVPKVEVESSPK